MDNIKIKCLICYKSFKKKYKSKHDKTQHHLICEQIINDINFKKFESINNKIEIKRTDDEEQFINLLLNH
jgi:hypothetical protein